MTISASQIRAARGMLNWNQKQLAYHSRLGITTIRNLESVEKYHRSETATVLRVTLEKAGVEFVEPNGVKQKDSNVSYYESADSCDKLFNDIAETMRQIDAEVIFEFHSSLLMSAICSNKRGDFGRLATLADVAPTKCLVADVGAVNIAIPNVQIRVVSKMDLGPISYVAYGHKVALILVEPNSMFKFVVFNWPGFSDYHRDHFRMHWATALASAM